MFKSVLIAIALVTAVGTSAAMADGADPDVPKDHAVINFANLPHRINDWKAVGNKAILIEAPRGTWYKATFMSPCLDLPFAVRIGFVTDTMSQIDKFGSILVGHDRCWFKTFEHVSPPKKDGKTTDADQKP